MDDYTVFFQVHHAQGWQLWHSHSSAEIALVEKGDCRMIAGSASRDLQVGDAFFIPSGLPHGFVAEKQAGVQFTVMQISAEDLHCISLIKQLSKKANAGFFHLAQLDQKIFAEICHDLLRETMNALPYRREACQCLVGKAGILLLRSSSQTQAARTLTLQQHEMLDCALQWMQTHAHEGILISDVAAQVNVSSSYFRRIFFRKLGVGPKQYLNQLRLRHSRYLLLQRHLSIAEAAEKSGFLNPQQFSKAFKLFSGVSPLHWRNTNLQGIYTAS